MFHKLKNVASLPGFRLSVQFCEGVTKVYDLTPLFGKLPAFKRFFEGNPVEFVCVSVGAGGYGVVWNDDLDLSCEELWANGTPVETRFDGRARLGTAKEAGR